MVNPVDSEPTFRFVCTQCSRCCRHDPGFVFLSQADLDVLAGTLHLSAIQVIDRYCRWVPIGAVEQLSLLEQPNYDCIFWKDGGCSVYDGRPLQCRTYPFWAAHVESSADWAEEAAECPGIGIGRRYSAEEVRSLVSQRTGRMPIVRRR